MGPLNPSFVNYSKKGKKHWATFARIWHIYDAAWQNPFDSGKIIAHYLQGKYKRIYHPLNQTGDHVIVINSKEVALPGDEWVKRVYFHHTGYPGGASWTSAKEVHERDATLIMKKAVWSSLKHNIQRRYTMERLHIFPDDKVPQDMLENVTNQIRQLRPVPKKLDHYTKEEIENFPKIMDWPENYVLQ